MPYIRPAALENLKLYQYSCTDASLLSKYILQPYWRTMIHLVPLFIAPNLVTLIGSFALFINTITAFIYFPNLQGEAPGWVYLSFAIGIQWYSLLDNLDGKQARRTQNASPLGELFDHGCDCLAVALIALIMACVAQAGPGLLAFLCLMTGETGFWLATWEEYHTGSLYLGIVNGPTEGLQLISLFYLAAYFFGGQIFLQQYQLPFPIAGYETVQLNHLILSLYVFVSVVTLYFNIKSVRDAIHRRHSQSATVVSSLLGLLSYGLMALFTTIWFVYSDVMTNYPFLFFLGVALCMGELTSRLILAHVTLEPFATVQRPHLLLGAVALNTLSGLWLGAPIVPEFWSAVLLLGGSLVLFSHYVLSVIHQICTFLDIYCLRINKPKVK